MRSGSFPVARGLSATSPAAEVAAAPIRCHVHHVLSVKNLGGGCQTTYPCAGGKSAALPTHTPQTNPRRSGLALATDFIVQSCARRKQVRWPRENLKGEGASGGIGGELRIGGPGLSPNTFWGRIVVKSISISVAPLSPRAKSFLHPPTLHKTLIWAAVAVTSPLGQPLWMRPKYVLGSICSRRCRCVLNVCWAVSTCPCVGSCYGYVLKAGQYL